MRAGEFKEQPWELFRITHFPGLTTLEMADVLGAWAGRHRVNLKLSERRVELGGKVYLVPHFKLVEPG